MQYIQLVDAICQHLPEVQRPESSKFVAACESADRLEVLKQRKQVIPPGLLYSNFLCNIDQRLLFVVC